MIKKKIFFGKKKIFSGRSSTGIRGEEMSLEKIRNREINATFIWGAQGRFPELKKGIDIETIKIRRLPE